MSWTFVFNLLSEQGVIALLQMFVGKWAKKQPWFDNKFIPALTYVLGILGFTLGPASAHAAALGGLTAGMGNVFAFAALQNLFITGTHSTFKNFVIPTFWDIIKVLAKRVESKAVASRVGD